MTFSRASLMDLERRFGACKLGRGRIALAFRLRRQDEGHLVLLRGERHTDERRRQCPGSARA